ncbi:MAG: TRAP transporter small permease subunit [Alphaproteobacteria bacterium]
MGRLQHLASWIDRCNEAVGRTVAWLTVGTVLVQFTVVVLRYVFGVGLIWMQESIIYMHATVLMAGAGYTLLHGGHVRVDIFYRTASPERKAWTDLLGVVFFLIPVMILIITVAWPYVATSWASYEGSAETSGIQAVFVLKSVILVFAALVLLQGISLAIASALVLAGVPVPPPGPGDRF